MCGIVHQVLWQVGERVERCRGNSALSGQYVVEDVRYCVQLEW